MEETMEDENLSIRFRKLKEQKDLLEAEVQRLNKSYSNKFDKLSAENVELKNSIKNINLSHESEKVLMSNGVTDEGLVDYIKFQYNKVSVEEGQEKPSFADFFSEFKEVSPLLKKDDVVKADVAESTKATQESVVDNSLDSLKPETPAKDSSFKGTGAENSLSVGAITPRDFAKLTTSEQDQLFVSMGLKR